MDAEADQAAVFHQAALDDAREQGDVNISGGNQDADFFPDSAVLRFRTAAAATAPAPSVSVFSFSSSSRMALAISSSSTVTISSTYFWTSGRVSTPAERTAMPSAMVFSAGSVTMAFSSTAAFMDGHFEVCTPITLIW